MAGNYTKMSPGEASHEEMFTLIDLVRACPVLYDPTNNDYKDYGHTENAWNLIAKQIGRRDMSGGDWRKKWVNRRDTYVKKKRQIRNETSLIAVERAKRWRYYDAMSFLDRFFEVSGDSGEQEYNVHPLCVPNEDDSSEAISGDDDQDESTSALNIIRQKMASMKRPAPSPGSFESSVKRKPLDSENNSNFVALPPQSSVNFNGTDEIQDSFSNSIADQLDQPLSDQCSRPQSPCSTRVTFPDYHLLFQSYAHRLERLPQQMQSLIQLQIAQIFYNADNPDRPPVPITPLPSSSASMASSSSASSCSPLSRQSQKRRQDEEHSQGQQLQLQHQPTLPHSRDSSFRNQAEMRLAYGIRDNHVTTLIKDERP